MIFIDYFDIFINISYYIWDFIERGVIMDHRNCGNTKLSLLNRSQLLDFLGFVNNEQLLFRDKLDISDIVSYGNEIEVNDIELLMMKDVVLYFNKEHGLSGDSAYEAHEEMTASSEVVTPILQNSTKSWSIFYDMYRNLNMCGATISGNTASHIHVGTHQINTGHKLSLLLKTLVVFEPIIFKFGYGMGNVPRDIIRCVGYNSNYAMMMSPIRINQFIKDIEKCISKGKGFDYEYFKTFLALDLDYRPAFNFKDFDYDKLNYELPVTGPKTFDNIEFRCFNGTLQPEIAQNNINLIAHIIEAVATGMIDEDYIEEEYKRYKKKTYNFDVWKAVILDEKEGVRYNRLLDGFGKVKLDKAIKLADMIFRNDLDKVYFLKQYLKLFQVSEEEIKKLIK